MTRHGVWIGVDAASMLSSPGSVHVFVEQARDHSRVVTEFDGLRVQAVRSDGFLLGYGVIIALTPSGGKAELDGDTLAVDTERVRRALRDLGVYGAVTVHVQSVDVYGPAAVH